MLYFKKVCHSLLLWSTSINTTTLVHARTNTGVFVLRLRPCLLDSTPVALMDYPYMRIFHDMEELLCVVDGRANAGEANL